MIRFAPAAVLALAPGLAAAHEGPAGHAHPHGLEMALAALAAVAIGVALWRALR